MRRMGYNLFIGVDLTNIIFNISDLNNFKTLLALYKCNI